MPTKNRYNITINVVIKIKRAIDGRRIAWISFKGWKHGILIPQNRLISTDPIVKMTDENMKYIWREVFHAAKEMFKEDESLEFYE